MQGQHGAFQIGLFLKHQTRDGPHAHTRKPRLDAENGVFRPYLARLKDTGIKARAPGSKKAFWKGLKPHLHGKLEAWHTGLGNLDDGTSNPELVADMDAVFGHALDGEIFAELPERKILAPKLARPIGVMLEWIGINRLARAAVIFAIGLAVPFEVLPMQRHPAFDGTLENAGRDGFSKIFDYLRLRKIDGKELHGMPHGLPVAALHSARPLPKRQALLRPKRRFKDSLSIMPPGYAQGKPLGLPGSQGKAKLSDPFDQNSPDAREVAVAIQYDKEKDRAPKIAASGKGALAERILEIAFLSGVKVRKDEDLAELLSALEIGKEIPIEAFTAIAEILSYVYRTNSANPTMEKRP